MILGLHIRSPNNIICRAWVFKNQINLSRSKKIQPHVYRWIRADITIGFSLKQIQYFCFSSFLPESSLCFSLCSDPFLCMPSFHVIYRPLYSIFTTHVQVGFRGSLSVPSKTFWNLFLVAVKLFHHCSGITSILMRPESWLRGN